MRSFCLFWFVCAFILTTLLVIGFARIVIVNYQFSRDYKALWDLADRASTIPAKEEKLAAFVAKLKESHDFSDHNAIFLTTDANSFDANVAALDTLVGRLREIRTMPSDSFQYNTAIQQITAQEQGEAHEMMAVFHGCYVLHNATSVWDWIGVTIFIVLGILDFIVICAFLSD